MSRRDSRRPRCAVRPGPGRGVCPARPGAGGSAPSLVPGPQHGTAGLAAGSEASILSVPGGGSRSRLREAPPARPRGRSCRRLGWRRFPSSSVPLSFIAGVKWRWGLSCTEPRLVCGALCAPAPVPAAEGSYPNKGSAQLSGASFSCWSCGVSALLWGAVSGPGHESFHLLCFTLAKPSVTGAQLKRSWYTPFSNSF